MFGFLCTSLNDVTLRSTISLSQHFWFDFRFIGLRAENSGTYKCRIETMDTVYEKEFELKIEGQDGNGVAYTALSPGW